MLCYFVLAKADQTDYPTVRRSPAWDYAAETGRSPIPQQPDLRFEIVPEEDPE